MLAIRLAACVIVSSNAAARAKYVYPREIQRHVPVREDRAPTEYPTVAANKMCIHCGLEVGTGGSTLVASFSRAGKSTSGEGEFEADARVGDIGMFVGLTKVDLGFSLPANHTAARSNNATATHKMGNHRLFAALLSGE